MEFGGRPIHIGSLKKAAALPFLLMAVFLLSGCQVKDLGQALESVDDGIGRAFNDFQRDQQSIAINLFDKKAGVNRSTTTAASLTDDQKVKIDDWLDKKGLNRYGDDKSAMYKGGTPLFDEATGKAIDRYDYILSRYPNILEEIK
jgi:hypothetical protein